MRKVVHTTQHTTTTTHHTTTQHTTQGNKFVFDGLAERLPFREDALPFDFPQWREVSMALYLFTQGLENKNHDLKFEHQEKNFN